MSKSVKRLSLALVVALCLATVLSATAFAAEAEEVVQISTNEEVNMEKTGISIETNDPNIVIRVTPITENTPMPMDIRGVHTTFDYHGSLNGPWRTYHGNHFSMDIKTSSVNRDGNFVMKLVRKSGLFNDVVGKVELPRDGSFHVEILNVYKPNEQYRLEFKQTQTIGCQQWGSMDIWDWD